MNNHTQSTVYRYKMADQVYDILKGQILKGVLVPGEEISADQLARKLNTSKTPVREALHRLKGERLVVDADKGKIIVIELSPEEVTQIGELYATLQTLALKWGFARIPREKLHENLKMLQEAKKNLEKGNPEYFLEADVILHDLIVAAPGNQWLIRIVTQVRNFIAIIRNMFPTMERYREAWHDHVAIVESILKGDRDSAIKNLNLHTEHVNNHLLASLKQKQADDRGQDLSNGKHGRSIGGS